MGRLHTLPVACNMRCHKSLVSRDTRNLFFIPSSAPPYRGGAEM